MTDDKFSSRGVVSPLGAGGEASAPGDLLPGGAAPTIRAELAWSDHAKALGILARGSSPVLNLCRKLVDAGCDPASPLEAWRDSTLALRVRSIGEATGLAVGDDNIGRPRFRRQRTNAGADSAAQNKCGGTNWLDWPTERDAP